MKPLKEMINADAEHMYYWQSVCNDASELKEVGKTREEAASLANYYEGRLDALTDIKYLLAGYDAGVIDKFSKQLSTGLVMGDGVGFENLTYEMFYGFYTEYVRNLRDKVHKGNNYERCTKIFNRQSPE